MRRLYRQGYTQEQIARLLNAGRKTVGQAVAGITRPDVSLPMPTIVFDERDVTPRLHVTLPPPPQDSEDPKPDRLRARVAAGQSIEDAARAERVSVKQARALLCRP